MTSIEFVWLVALIAIVIIAGAMFVRTTIKQKAFMFAYFCGFFVIIGITIVMLLFIPALKFFGATYEILKGMFRSFAEMPEKVEANWKKKYG